MPVVFLYNKMPQDLKAGPAAICVYFVSAVVFSLEGNIAVTVKRLAVKFCQLQIFLCGFYAIGGGNFA